MQEKVWPFVVTAAVATGHDVTGQARRPFSLDTQEGERMNLLYVILIIVLVLVLLGFVGRGRW